MTLDFGRTADRIYINAKQSVTLMGRAGGGGGKTGLYLLPVYTMVQTIKKIAQAVKYRVRRLTPLECERLDGFPDGWTQYGASGKEMSDNARYMALGNSIAAPCAERVFIGICKAERQGENESD